MISFYQPLGCILLVCLNFKCIIFWLQFLLGLICFSYGSCFTTEILEGFDVQRTSGLADTLRKYGYLTQLINQYYRSLDPVQKCVGVCPPFDEFINKCEELDKMTVSDVFAVQLMQVYITLKHAAT